MSPIDASASRHHSELDPDELLQRLPDLTIHLQSNGSIHIESEDRGHLFGPHTLRVLEAFSKPATFKTTMETLRSQVLGVQDWVDLSDTILNLYRSGVLDTVDRASQRPSSRTGFDAAVEHVLMLNDRARTDAYLHAISEVVQPEDVVVELGTGTGVLAVAAAKAGARHVYAVEAGAIGKTAEAVFAANGLSDRITLVSGLSTHVTLPERADVLISEIIGNEPLHERVLESTRDAIKRFLKPDARFVPRTLRIYAVPVDIPESLIARYRFMESTQAEWRDWYGVDFSPLSQWNAPTSLRVLISPRQARDWTRLSEPALLAEIDLSSGHPPRIDRETHVVASRQGLINGVVVYFELGLSPSIELSVNPERADDKCSWHLPLWLLPELVEVERGERLALAYTYGVDKRRSRLTITKASSQE
jgi:protein arginine N-methyltransferase 1